ncbi:MAG: hypothetical protein Q9220_006982 [cf. Caloplaca sp. 1 TL-2023]
MNAADVEASSNGNLHGFYAYKNTFDADNVWLNIPENITFVNVEDPYSLPSSPELDDVPTKALNLPFGYEKESEASRGGDHERGRSRGTQSHGLEALSAAALYIPSNASATQEASSYAQNGFHNFQPSLGEGNNEDIGSMASQSAALNLSGPNLDFILNSDSTFPSAIDPSLDPVNSTVPAPQDSNNARRSQFKASTETSHRTAFLLRHFSEVTGRWMDLFDQNTFFGSHIPVKSISNPLLKHAACAYAAKQLGRVAGKKALVGGYCTQQASMEIWHDADKEDWAQLAGEHHDEAISLLMEALQWDHSSSEANTSENIDKRQYAPRTIEGMVEERKLRRRQFGSAQSTARSDDLLAATSILCEYASLDASNTAWACHLSGTKTLLDVVEVGMMPLEALSPEHLLWPSVTRKPSQARKAVFWNFARQDVFAAFVNECRTRLDTEDIPMWKDAGLLLDENGLVVPSNNPELGLPEDALMREDMSGNALIWLLSKMMNLICANSSPNTSEQQQQKPSQESLSEKWNTLSHEMETWFNGLPETFMPSAIIPVSLHGTPLTEVWHSIPLCAATTITWHMAQVLLLVHHPSPPLLPTNHTNNNNSRRANHTTTIAHKVNSYRNIQYEITYHSKQIVGLCLARPDAGVRIHAMQPLFVAGQCLVEEGQRKVVVDLLRGIERDLGWATEYRVRQLRGEWGWDEGEGEVG